MREVANAGQRFWVNTVSLDHVRVGVAGGFTQADHGKSTRLRNLRVGDWGMPFRRGLFAIPEHDFALIARLMQEGSVER